MKQELWLIECARCARPKAPRGLVPVKASEIKDYCTRQCPGYEEWPSPTRLTPQEAVVKPKTKKRFTKIRVLDQIWHVPRGFGRAYAQAAKEDLALAAKPKWRQPDKKRISLTRSTYEPQSFCRRLLRLPPRIARSGNETAVS